MCLRVSFITKGAGQKNIENIRSSVGIKTTMRRIFILLRKFNGDGAEVFSGSIHVRNMGKRQKKTPEKVRERIFKAIS